MRNKKWTEEDLKFLKDNYLNISDSKIGRILGRSKNSIEHKRRQIQLSIPLNIESLRQSQSMSSYHKSVEEKRLKLKLHLKGYSIYSIVYFANQERKLIARKYKSKNSSLEGIIQEISKIFEIPIEDIVSKKRKQEFVFCRQIFCFIAKRMHPSFTLDRIGKFVGYPDHTSANGNIAAVNGYLKIKDPEFMGMWYSYLSQTEIFKQ